MIPKMVILRIHLTRSQAFWDIQMGRAGNPNHPVRSRCGSPRGIRLYPRLTFVFQVSLESSSSFTVIGLGGGKAAGASVMVLVFQGLRALTAEPRPPVARPICLSSPLPEWCRQGLRLWGQPAPKTSWAVGGPWALRPHCLFTIFALFLVAAAFARRNRIDTSSYRLLASSS